MSEINQTPRNGFLGGLADLLMSAKQKADYISTPESTPLLGKVGLGSLLFGESPRVIDNMSYGESPVRFGSTNNGLAGAIYGMKVDPGVIDTAGLLTGANQTHKALGSLAQQGLKGLLQTETMKNASKQASVINNVFSSPSAMSTFDTTGLTKQQASSLIKGEAEKLADLFRKNNFQVNVDHSGSALGPSSYLSVFDPSTGKFWRDIRVSNHSKGPYNNQFVTNVAGQEEYEGLLNQIIKQNGGVSSSIFNEPLDKINSDGARQAFDAFKEARDSGVSFSRYKARNK